MIKKRSATLIEAYSTIRPFEGVLKFLFLWIEDKNLRWRQEGWCSTFLGGSLQSNFCWSSTQMNTGFLRKPTLLVVSLAVSFLSGEEEKLRTAWNAYWSSLPSFKGRKKLTKILN